MTAPHIAATMTSGSDNLLSNASTPPSRHAISPGKMNPRKVEASSAGIANTISKATHGGRVKICSTTPFMGNILTHYVSRCSSRHGHDDEKVEQRRGMVTLRNAISMSSWYATSPVVDRNHLPRRHVCRQNSC